MPPPKKKRKKKHRQYYSQLEDDLPLRLRRMGFPVCMEAALEIERLRQCISSSASDSKSSS